MGDEAKNCQLPPPKKLLWAPTGNGTLHPSARVLGYSQRRKEDSFLLLFSFNLGLYCAVHGILVPQPRVKPMPPAWKAHRPNHQGSPREALFKARISRASLTGLPPSLPEE